MVVVVGGVGVEVGGRRSCALLGISEGGGEERARSPNVLEAGDGLPDGAHNHAGVLLELGALVQWVLVCGLRGTVG